MSKLAEQIDEAAEISSRAFAAGDVVTGIAAIQLAAQLVQIMRFLEKPAPPDSLPTRSGK